MHFLKRRIILVGILLVVASTLATDYYMQDFFPIGFTGFNNTHYSKWDYPGDPWDGSPYPETEGYPYGTWLKEKELLDSTHCNFIGCSDAIDLTNIFA